MSSVPPAEGLGTQSQSPTWDPRSKRTIALILFAFGVVLLWYFRGALVTLMASLILGYLLYPVANFFQRWLLGGRLRPLAVLLSFLLVIGLVVLLALVVFPTLLEQLQGFLSSLPGQLSGVQTFIVNLLTQPLMLRGEPLLVGGQPVILAELLNLNTTDAELASGLDVFIRQISTLDIFQTTQTLATGLGNITRPAFSFLGTAIGAVLNTVFLLTMTFYLVKDGGIFVERVIGLVPEDNRADARRLLYELGNVWDSYFRGQIVLCVIMGVAMFILATALGIPNAIILALIAAVMEAVPNLGPVIALFPAAALALFTESTTIPGLSGVPFMLLVIGLWTVMQQVEAVILIPRVMGSTLNLHPFVVIVALLGGATVGGILGVLLAVPVLATGRFVLQYVYGKLTDTDPFPAVRPRHAREQDLRRRQPVLVRLIRALARWARTSLRRQRPSPSQR